MNDYEKKVDDAKAIGAAVFAVMEKLRAENERLLLQLEEAADCIDALRALLAAQSASAQGVER